MRIWRSGKKAVEYACNVVKVSEKIETSRKHYRLLEQMESAAVSIASNIAEGKGRYSKKEFVQFLYIARGSLYESITQLAIVHKNEWIPDDDFRKLKSLGAEVGKMISGLINSIKKGITS